MDERSFMGSHPFPGMPGSTATIRPDVVEPPSPEDGTNLKRSLQIDMKGLMGDAVGNVSTIAIPVRARARVGAGMLTMG